MRSSSRSRSGRALLVGDHQRVLRVARRMAGRKVHALEVVVVGLDFGPDAHRIPHRRKHADDLIHRPRDRMLGANQPPRSRQCDVDSFGLEGRVGGA